MKLVIALCVLALPVFAQQSAEDRFHTDTGTRLTGRRAVRINRLARHEPPAQRESP